MYMQRELVLEKSVTSMHIDILLASGINKEVYILKRVKRKKNVKDV